MTIFTLKVEHRAFLLNQLISLARQAVEIARKFEKLYSQRQVALRSDSIH
jgi:hypothetical protein